jgi:hypothetical protein
MRYILRGGHVRSSTKTKQGSAAGADVTPPPDALAGGATWILSARSAFFRDCMPALDHLPRASAISQILGDTPIKTRHCHAAANFLFRCMNQTTCIYMGFTCCLKKFHLCAAHSRKCTGNFSPRVIGTAAESEINAFRPCVR